MSPWRLSLLTLLRDWRAGELRLLAAALVVACASASSVGFFTDRVRQAMTFQSAALLAADLAVTAPQPITDDLAAEAVARGLTTATTVALRSVASAGNRMQLIELKAVGPGYPLRGSVRIADVPYGPARDAAGIPEAGTLWVEPRLLQVLGISSGERISLGARDLTVAATLVLEPDRGGDFFSIAPRALMNLDDLPSTGLLLPGSQVTYRLLVAGPPRSVADYKDWLPSRLGPKERILDVQNARPELRAALTRAEQFLGLAALVSTLLAGVAIALAARRYALRHVDSCAVLRCLGATQRLVLQTVALEMLWLGLAAGLVGCLVGYVAQWGLAALMPAFTAGELPPPGLAPVASGLALGLATLFGFALPPLAALRNVPPARVLRRDLDPPPWSPVLGWLLPITVLLILAPWRSGEARVTAYVLAGTAGTILVLATAAWLLVRILGALRSRVGVAWRYGLANVARRAGASVVQTVALGLGIMVMLLLTLVRADLLAGWSATLPPDAPNQFLVNVQPDETEAMEAFFADRGLPAPRFYPMVRGRLIAINDRPVRIEDYEDTRAQRLADREFNLSWAATPQPDNRIVAGRWWDGPGVDPQQFSVETGIAETLGLELGDTLTYRVADRELSGRITSLRTVEWDSFNVNFFVIAAPGLLEGFPATYISSFHLAGEDKTLLTALLKQFPSVTVIDVEALMTQVRSIMDRVTHAVEFVFGFTLLAGVLVLLAAIQATHDQRMQESAVLRTLGASSRVLLAGLAAELLVLGLVSGVLAAAAATLTGKILASEVFAIPYSANPWVWIAGTLAGSLGVTLAGALGMRAVLQAPPTVVLRRA